MREKGGTDLVSFDGSEITIDTNKGGEYEVILESFNSLSSN